MKTALILLCACVGLSGCAGLQSATPEQTAALVNALANAGCSGSFSITFGGGTGQLGGGLQANNTFTGNCDPSKARVAQSVPSK
jgi:hypothetical protein